MTQTLSNKILLISCIIISLIATINYINDSIWVAIWFSFLTGVSVVCLIWEYVDPMPDKK